MLHATMLLLQCSLHCFPSHTFASGAMGSQLHLVCYCPEYPATLDVRRASSPYPLCHADGKYHLLDRFGHKMATVVVPLTVDNQAEEQEQQFEQGGAAPLAPALALAAGVSSGGGASGHMLREGSEAAGLAPEHVPSSTAAEGEMDYMNNRVRLATCKFCHHHAHVASHSKVFVLLTFCS